MKFKKALCFSLFPLTLVPIIILGVISLSVGIQNVNKLATESLEELAEASGRNLENYIKAQQREIELISKIKQINDGLAAYEQDAMTDDIMEHCQQALNDWVESDINYSAAFLLDREGRVIASYDGMLSGRDFSGYSFYRDRKESATIKYGEVEKSFLNPEQNVIYISYPIEIDGYLGILGLETDVAFYDSLVENIKYGETGASFIVDKNGMAFCHSDPDKGGYALYHPRIGTIVTDYQDGLIPKNSSFSYKYENDSRLLGYYVIEGMGWAFSTRESFSEINKPIIFLTVFYILLFVSAVLFDVIICLALIRMFTSPVNRLLEVFLRAANENNYVECEMIGNNEFSELARGYNTMMERLIVKDKELKENYQMLAQEQERNHYMAFHDDITDSYNRRAFEKKLDELLMEEQTGAVFYLGIGGFKNANALFGKDIGDLCLKAAAQRICNLKNAGVMTARPGGDEFYIIKLGEEAEINQFAEELLQVLKDPFVFEPVSVKLSVSIGIARFPEDAGQTPALMNCADIALYEAKSNGKNQYCYYKEEMTDDLNHNNEVLEVLDYAIDTGEAFLCYQPEVEIKSNEIIAFEALMRIKSERLGYLSPAEFIPLAESSGRIIELGKWVLAVSVRYAKQLLKKKVPFEYISVNISAIQLEQSDFNTMVLETLEKAELEPHYLMLEITESMLMSESGGNVKKLSALRDKGIKIALDDFGTGYSSMQYLAELPLDVLKIDKFFIDEILFDDKKRKIIKDIISMVHHLGIKVVAEGVESKEQSDLLKEMKCDIIQGYYYYMPTPGSKLLDALGGKGHPI